MFGAVSAGIPSFGDLSWKAPVRVVQVGDLPSQVGAAQTITRSGNGALPSIDGVSLAVGDRVLIAKQTNGYQEGIYQVVTLGSAGSPWQLRRTTDCDSSAEMVVGASCYITAGTRWSGTTAVAGASWTPTSGDADWQPTPQLAYVRTVFTNDGTWTRTNELAQVVVTCVGAGGGGGGTQATAAGEGASGGGGGGGSMAVKSFAATALAATEQVKVGDGGAGNSGAAGAAGEFSAFAYTTGYEVNAGGGGGGSAGANTAGNTRVGGGAGGVATGGDVNAVGSDGGNGVVIGGQYVPVGHGGSSSVGGLTRATLAANGATGNNYGGGGSGSTAGASSAARSGGQGGQGIVIVEEYVIERGSWG